MNAPFILSEHGSGEHLGRAWLALAAALAIHIADEAATDFLSVYNPSVRAIRERLPWLPLPTFSFSEWLAGLAILVAVLFALAPVAYRGARWITIIAEWGPAYWQFDLHASVDARSLFIPHFDRSVSDIVDLCDTAVTSES
jgi:hypothetical protein